MLRRSTTLTLALCVAITNADLAQEDKAAFRPVAPSSLYFPSTGESWASIEPSRSSWDTHALGRAVDYAGRLHSSSVVILIDGRIAAERVWDVQGPERYSRMRLGTTRDGNPIEDVGSTQKNIIAFLAGIAEAKGLLDLGAPVDRYIGKGWSKTPATVESAITVRDVMGMVSGLTDSLEFEAPVGRRWRYNNPAYVRLIGVLERITGMDVDTLTREWLTKPIGMADSRWTVRSFSATNPNAFVTTARDLARFGLLVLSGGIWDQQDLLRNPGYLKRMLSPSQDSNPSYGLFWWLNGQPRVQRQWEERAHAGSLIPAAPSDLVATMGTGDRKCYIVPSLRMVVARLGDQIGDQPVSPEFDNEFWALIMKAAPR